MVYSAVLAVCGTDGHGFKPWPEPPLMFADMSVGKWIEKAQLPLYSQQVTKHASKGSTLALKPRRDITRSTKQGYQWPHEKDLCPQIFF